MTALHEWRHAFTSDAGPKSSVTRLLLWTLSSHMDKDGGSCFPSVRTIAKKACISPVTVVKHIQIAVELGWIVKAPAGSGGQGWRRNQYCAAIPEKVIQQLKHLKVEVVQEVKHVGPEGVSPEKKRVSPESKKVFQQVKPSSSSSYSKNTMVKGQMTYDLDPDFLTWWTAFPRKVKKQDTFKIWQRLKKKKILPSIKNLLASLKSHKKSEQWQRDGGQFIPHPSTWLSGRRWEDEVLIAVPKEDHPQKPLDEVLN